MILLKLIRNYFHFRYISKTERKVVDELWWIRGNKHQHIYFCSNIKFNNYVKREFIFTGNLLRVYMYIVNKDKMNKFLTFTVTLKCPKAKKKSIWATFVSSLNLYIVSGTRATFFFKYLVNIGLLITLTVKHLKMQTTKFCNKNMICQNAVLIAFRFSIINQLLFAAISFYDLLGIF